jgi:predicted nucleic-acid-binding protein
MSMLLDTNTIIRFAVGTPKKQFLKVEAVMKDAARGVHNLLLEPMVLAESVFVLSSFCEQSRKEISDGLIGLVNSAEVISEDPKVLVLALEIYAKQKLDFVDCYLASRSILTGEEVLSFDKDFGKIEGVNWVNPTNYK